MAPSKKFIEHREVKRHLLSEYLEVFDHQTDKVIGKLADVSLQGIKLTSHEQISTGKKFQLKMIIPKDIIKKGSIGFEARSVWCGTDKSPENFAVGFKTTSISDKNRILLTELIRSAESEEGDEND